MLDDGGDLAHRLQQLTRLAVVGEEGRAIVKLEEGIDAFMRNMFYRGYRDPIATIKSWLMKGPVGRKPSSADVEVHRWYKELDEESRLIVHRIVDKTARVTLFGILVRLDNLSGGYAIEGKLSDFALYVQSYPDHAAHSNNQPDMAIRLNSPNNLIDMHDLIQQYIDKLGSNEESTAMPAARPDDHGQRGGEEDTG